MPTLRILYDVDGWAYHHRARALRHHAPPDFAVTLGRLSQPDEMAAALGTDEPDILFVLSTPQIAAVRQAVEARGWRAKLVGSWNDGWPLQIPRFFDAYRLTHAMVINNATAWQRVGRLPRTYMLPNGVDGDVFRMLTPLHERAPRVLWTGSELGRRRKGYDRLLLPLERRLRQLGIDCDFRLVDSYGDDKRAPEAMAAWYNSGTVLVCTSVAEGTPNTALEAAACGCTIVSTPVGNMPELIRDGENGYLVPRTLDAIVAAVRAACANHPRLATQMLTDIGPWSWGRRSPLFFAAFRQILSSCQPPPATLDLSDRVTAFVTTVGAPSYPTCRELLRLQDCTFRLEVIDRVAPMSAAFQRMLDHCQTPFFVQVDEDMLLHPHAVRTLYERIAAADDRVAIVIGDLYDAHLERRIHGVKIYRHEIARRYPFTGVQSFEKLQAGQMKADGYVFDADNRGDGSYGDGVLGLHGTHWTAQSLYERYAALESRRRRHPRDLAWFEPYPAVFLERVLEDPTEANVAALMGVLSAALPAAEGAGTAKDFRVAPPGFAAAQRFYDELRPRRTPDRRPARA